MSAPILALREARVSFGAKPLFENVSLAIGTRERACLVGRNGSGKSTLLKALTGLIELDGGERFVQPGVAVAYLPQDQSFSGTGTVAEFVAGGLKPHPEGVSQAHRVDEVLDHVGIAGRRQAHELSGGESRRVALARALVGRPDVLLLDEPTNHLDLATVFWLESYLTDFPGAWLAISHDRAFLSRLSERTFWLEGGALRTLDKGFAAFDEWSENILDVEEKAAWRLDKRLAEELHWLHRGVTARRRRNQGRLKRLALLRRERAERDRMPPELSITTGKLGDSPRLVVAAERISKSFSTEAGDGAGDGVGDGDLVIVRDFSTRILKGDRVGVIGPNGAGKSTLLRLLIGEIEPDRGRIRRAQTLEIAYFDQRRARLDPAKTLWATLCEAGGDKVFVQGWPRHVVGYLKDFLFTERQARSPVGSLSGGERNRLLLAKILAQPSNLLVLDEPTNDLDMDTLDLLQEVLSEYEGTLLLVSHDRDFLDRLVTSVIAVEGEGRVREYVGGYSDYVRQREGGVAPERAGPAAAKAAKKAPKRAVAKKDASKKDGAPRPAGRPTRLSYNEQRELDALPGLIQALEDEGARIEDRLADPAFYAEDRAVFEQAAARLAALRGELAAAEDRWLALEHRREEISRGREEAGAAGGAGRKTP